MGARVAGAPQPDLPPPLPEPEALARKRAKRARRVTRTRRPFALPFAMCMGWAHPPEIPRVRGVMMNMPSMKTKAQVTLDHSWVDEEEKEEEEKANPLFH